MMNGLIIPAKLPRLRIHRYDTVRKQILALPGPAIKIRGRTTRPEINDPPLFIDHHPSPAIGTPDLLISIRGPGRITRVSRQRYGMEYPFQFARDDIEGAYMPGSGITVFGNAAADDQGVFINDSRGRRSDHRSLHVMTQSRCQPFMQIDSPMIPKSFHRPARAGVDGIQIR